VYNVNVDFDILLKKVIMTMIWRWSQQAPWT